MELQDQITRLELSKKLKDLGIKQESQFYIAPCRYIAGKEIDKINVIAHVSQVYDIGKSFISAFTVSELAEEIRDYDFNINLYFKDKSQWIVYFSPEYGTDNSYSFTGPNLADLIAEMIIAKHNEDKIQNES